MQRGEFNNIDELLNELKLIPGTTLDIGGESNFFDCCHIDINPRDGIKEGWINSIHSYLGEMGDTVTDFSITLKLGLGIPERPSINVNKAWIDENVTKINIWSYK